MRDEQTEKPSWPRKPGRTPSETSAPPVEEALRRGAFAFIDFRGSAVGRQAYVQGSGLAVWEVVLLARCYDLSPARTAEHLGWATPRVQSALNYASAYPEEIEQAIADSEAFGFESLARMLPAAECFVVEDASDETCRA